MTVAFAALLASVSLVKGLRRGMAPAGAGMACVTLVLVLYRGFLMFGTPWLWPVAAQAIILMAGLYALVRQTGVFR